METGQIIALAFLIVLSLSIVGSFVAQSREGRGRGLQQLVVWALIFVGVLAAVGLWDDLSGNVQPRQASFDGGVVEVPRAPDGHYHLTLTINDVEVDFLVDTGATMVVLNQADAERIGLNPSELAYIHTAMTANGEVRTAPVRLDKVQLGDLVDRNLRASVNSAQLDKSLLGMSYLSQFESIEIRRDRLILTP